jgi:hypothetical protein
MDDCCEHFDDDGEPKPEFKAAFETAAENDRLAAEAEAKQCIEDERLAEEYWNSLDAHGRSR